MVCQGDQGFQELKDQKVYSKKHKKSYSLKVLQVKLVVHAQHVFLE